MESQSQNPEFWNNPENFHLCIWNYDFAKIMIRKSTTIRLYTVGMK